MKIKALVANRSSIVKGAGTLSRSVEERIAEPLWQVTQNSENFEFFIKDEEKIEDFDFLKCTHLIMNRPHSQKSQAVIDAAKKHGITVVVDIDDIPTLFPEEDTAALSPSQKSIFDYCVKAANHVTCSTEEILNWLKLNLNITSYTIIPTSINFEKLKNLAVPKAISPHTSACFTNAGSIKLGVFNKSWMEVLSGFLCNNGLTLDVISDRDQGFGTETPLRNLGQMEWKAHKAFLMQSNYRFAIIPLAGAEDPNHLKYSALKTPTKFISYGGAGIPGIYSSTPIYKKIIEDRVTGLLVENSSSCWAEALQEMHENSELRKRISTNSREYVFYNFSMEKTAAAWMTTLRN